MTVDDALMYAEQKLGLTVHDALTFLEMVLGSEDFQDFYAEGGTSLSVTSPHIHKLNKGNV